LRPTILVHGGAWKIAEETHTDHIGGTHAAAEAGWEILRKGGSALDAVEKAVMVMEDDPTFDAGVGSVLNREGDIELDAIIMDGRTLALGSVAAVRGIMNPIRLARLIAEDTEHSLLVSEGARRFAERKGMRLCAAAELTVPREVERFRRLQQTPDYHLDTDSPPIPGDGRGRGDRFWRQCRSGHFDRGTAFKLPGRVGDSPLVGSGAYADNLTGAASATGHGEKSCGSYYVKRLPDAIAHRMSAQEAANFAIKTMHERVGGYGGIILVDYRDKIAFAYNTPHMAAAWSDENGNIQARIKA